MIKLTKGNLLKSDAEALVNTANCAGYMGKGIEKKEKRKKRKKGHPFSHQDFWVSCFILEP